MRDEYEKFTSRGVEILAVGPNALPAFKQYWKNERNPFIGIPDPGHLVAQKYKQQVKLFKFGRMPLNCIIDGNGYIRFAHYGSSMSDIPNNEDLLHVIDELNEASK